MSDAVNLIQFQQHFKNEQSCINYLATARWNGNTTCPHCQHEGAYLLKTRNIYKCAKCREQFSVRTGTIFEESRLPLQKWFLAIYLLTSLKKGIPSTQMAKYLGITQKSAWFMLQRIRYAAGQKGYDAPLRNIVEADETYIGGKRHGTRGRGAKGKTPVAGQAERKGKVRCKAVPNVKSSTLVSLIRENVSINATIMTDEFRSYNALAKNGYAHKKVQHGIGQYVNGDAHTNTIEGFWSHMKRGITGVYLQVSRKHLQKYCDEYSYRYNSKSLTDFERFSDWFYRCNGRLTYLSLTHPQV